MAGNFWHSSHYEQWMIDRSDLLRERQEDLSVLTTDEYQKLIVFFANVIQSLGENLKLRQQIIATATIYFKRFYARNSLKCIDPLLMVPTCIFLAAKVEEYGVISNSRLISSCQLVLKTKFNYAYSQDFPYRIQHIYESEFYLLESMDCCLILYHPYRPLQQYINEISQEENLLHLSWRIVNDSLRTDVPLLYPPYLIALSAIHLASVILSKDLKQWFSDLNVDLNKLIEITKEILSLYELLKSFDEKKEIAALFAKMPKPKLTSSRPPSQGASLESSANNQALQNQQMLISP